MVKNNLLEPLQKNALQIAKDAKKEFKDLDLNGLLEMLLTPMFTIPTTTKNRILSVKKCLRNKISWAKEAGVDFVIAETITWVEEMKIALKAIKDAGLTAVCNFSIKKR